VETETRTDALLERAAIVGFELVCYATDNGQEVWEWRRGDEPRPQFVTERVARYWMFHWLAQARWQGRSFLLEVEARTTSAWSALNQPRWIRTARFAQSLHHGGSGGSISFSVTARSTYGRVFRDYDSIAEYCGCGCDTFDITDTGGTSRVGDCRLNGAFKDPGRDSSCVKPRRDRLPSARRFVRSG
jgi:hypothetical protein